MKIVKYNKIKENKYKVIFDNDLEVEMYDDVIVKYNLLMKKELSNKELEEILAINDKYMAYYEGIKFINKKLRTEKEIEGYLDKKGYKQENILYAIDKLKKDGYLNNKIYIESYINDQVNLGSSGPFKIRKKLVELGLREEEIDNYLEGISKEVWEDKLRKLISKRVKANHKMGEYKLKEKICYDLVNLGYSKEMISYLLAEVEIDDNSLIDKEIDKLYKKLSRKYLGQELELQLITKMMSKGFKYDEIKEGIKKLTN